MPTLIVHPSGVRAQVPVSDAQAVERNLHAVYARARIEELIRGILEDALSPSRLDVPAWQDEAPFEAEFAEAVKAITDATTDLVAEHLATLLETAPPHLAVRLAAAQRFHDHP